MGFASMFVAALYITFLPLLGDAVILTMAERVIKPTYERLKWTVALGMILHLPIVLFWYVLNASKGGTFNMA
jgi:hypothetical protein